MINFRFAVKLPATSAPIKRATAFGLYLAVAFGAGPAHAALTQTDVLVAERVIGFVEKFGSGVMRVGIVVAPDSAQSVQDGNDLKALLSNQVRAGDNLLQPILVRPDQLADADVGLFFLTDGIGAAASKVAIVSKGRKITCITFDITQVKNGTCTIGIQSRPKIEVVVNRKAAAESNTVFSSVFRLMITEY
ncbi:MAG TPA: hypothetical protein VNH44_04750 [Micropepsaceae bacterium]|nr:hypothetical protein [Micropepsaceae bacterium]